MTALLWCGLTTPYKNGPVIRSDGQGYHAWNHIILSNALGDCKLSKMGQLIQLPNGMCANKYPMGVALTTLPVYFLFDFTLSPSVISRFEHAITNWVGILLCLGSIVLLYLIAKFFGFTSAAAWFSTTVAILGTGTFHYATYDASFSHIYTVFCSSALIYLLFCVDKKSAFILTLIGFLSFWSILIRNTNIFMLSCLMLIYYRKVSTGQKQGLLVMAGGISIAVLLQISVNSFLHDKISFSSYANEGFIWSRPMFHKIIMSWERGLVNFYPAMALVLAVCLRQSRPCKEGLLIGSTLLFYAAFYGFWHSWKLGGGFGHRGFVDLMPLAFLGVMLNKDYFLRHKRIFLPAMILSTLITIILMAGYWNSNLPFYNFGRDTYLQQFKGTTFDSNMKGFIRNSKWPNIYADTPPI